MQKYMFPAVLTLVFMVVSCSPKEDPYVAKLEEKVQAYGGQIDSLNAVVIGFSDQLQNYRTQVDSARTANKTLVTALQKMTDSMQEYQGLYNKQVALNAELRTEVKQLRTERDRSKEHARKLESRVDSLDNELDVQRSRIARLEGQVKESARREAEAVKAITSVFVLSGTRETLEKPGYLEVKQATIFSDTYKLVNFPDVNDNRIKKVGLNEGLELDGEVRYVVDRYGKLTKGKGYQISQTGTGRSLVIFMESLLEGQRVLIVMKK
ncbi:MAG: hypothetical protein O2954_11960 [bacterium]|nr:hypothetical protein [bacterium]